jgi:hypothetical protein
MVADSQAKGKLMGDWEESWDKLYEREADATMRGKDWAQTFRATQARAPMGGSSGCLLPIMLLLVVLLTIGVLR